jgi:hypothetical protein
MPTCCFPWKPNAAPQLLPEAGAERTLEVVSCRRWLGVRPGTDSHWRPPRAPAMFEKGTQLFDADLRPSGLTLPHDSLVQQCNCVALTQHALDQDRPIDTDHTLVGFRDLP